MNHDWKQFEQRLRRQPVKPVPTAWRAEILSAARAATPAEAKPVPNSWPPAGTTWRSWFASLFWPHPRVWAGLAAVWVGIVVLQLSMREPSISVAKSYPPPSSSEALQAWRQQQRLYAELLGTAETSVTDRPRILFPKPHSQRFELRVI